MVLLSCTASHMIPGPLGLNFKFKVLDQMTSKILGIYIGLHEAAQKGEKPEISCSPLQVLYS